MKIRLLFIAVALLWMSSLVQASPVSPFDARLVAINFYNEQAAIAGINNRESVNVLASFSIDEKNIHTYDIFNMTTGGWVIVAADDRVTPVLAYSLTGSLERDKASPELQWWLGNYAQQIAEVVIKGLSAATDVASEWSALLNPSSVNLRQGTKTISPLLSSTWDQGKYYNYYCPEDAAGPGGRVWAGCVATSISQVMYYYRYPPQGIGSHGYNSDYGWLEADFGSTTYDWDAMQNSCVHGYNMPLALFQLHCGISVDMMYSPDGSGAYMDDATYALINYFGYSPTANLKYKNSYNDVQWANMLKADLDGMHPISYAGFGSGGGHAFVCDGYDATGKFHFNFGWSGYGDGYYVLSNLNPGSDFSDGQQAIFGIEPPAASYPVGCSGSKTLTAMQGSFEDGSGPIADYSPNADCYWLIDPTEPTDHIQLSFVKFATENANDIFTVYDGGTTADPVLGTFSGSTLPTEINSTGDKMLVHFTSNASVNAAGWMVEYKSIRPIYCPYLTNLTEPSGTFTDGSGAESYNINTSCRWRISPPGATGITINFTEFNLEGTDFVAIFDEESNIEIGTFLGTTLPSTIYISSPKAFIFFMSDALGTASGFSADYTSGTSDVATESDVPTLMVYPNPAQYQMNVAIAAQGLSRLTLINSMGQLVTEISGLPNANGVFTHSIDVSSLAPGLYYLTFENAGKKQRCPVSVAR